MLELFRERKAFNKAFGIESNDSFGNIPYKSYALEYDMAKEELNEYLEACKDNDLVEILDALGDQLYLLIGRCYNHGVTPEMLMETMSEIHASNMSKLTDEGEVLKRADGKIMKSVNFFPPNLKQFIK